MRRKSVDQPDLFAWAASRPEPAEHVDPVPAAVPAAPAEIASAGRKTRDCPRGVGSEAGPPIDFLARRPTMARWILGGRRDLQAFDLWLARKEGTMPPAPIIAFAPRAGPPDHGDGAPMSRAG